MKASDHILMTIVVICLGVLGWNAGRLRQRIERLESMATATKTTNLVIHAGQDLTITNASERDITVKYAVIYSGLTPQESTNLYNAAKEIRSETSLDRKIRDIKWRHELNWDLQKNGIALGYTACRLGMNLSNYLAEAEAAQNKLLEKKINEAKQK